MSRDTIAKRVAELTGESVLRSKATVRAVLAAIVQEVEEKGSVTLPGFGRFYLGKLKETRRFDITTREFRPVPPRTRLRFKPGTTFKRLVESEEAGEA
jgi:nucleoid DNA-binding protein